MGNAGERRHEARRAWWAGPIIALAALSVAGCGQQAPSPKVAAPPTPVGSASVGMRSAAPAPSPTLSPAIEERIEAAIAMRGARGMRFDREWVIAAEAQPGAAFGWGVRIHPGEAPRVVEGNLRWSMETREALGYRADEAWVRAVILDPTSVLRMNQLLLMPDEAALYDRAIDASNNLAPVIGAYGREHPDEWAGWYLDAGRPHILVSGHAAQHEVALEALFANTVDLTVSEVRWSQAELNRFRRQLKDPGFRARLAAADLDFEGHALETKENRVLLELSTDREGLDMESARDLAYEALGKRPGWLVVEVEILPPIPDLGYGSLVVTVVDAAGKPVTYRDVDLVPDVPRANAGALTGSTLGADGIAIWERIAATGYTVIVRATGSTDAELGSGHVVVPRDGEAMLTIVVTGEP